MTWAITAVAGGTAAAGLITGLIGQDASRSAANTAADASRNAANTQLQMFNQTQQNLQPYMQSGNLALSDLQSLMGIGPAVPGKASGAGGSGLGGLASGIAGAITPPAGAAGGASFNPNAPLSQPFGLSQFQASPAYQFNLQQGQMAIDKAASARGNYYAPQTLQDISKFSQGLASNEFQNAFQNYNVNQSNLFNRLSALASGGQNAAANLGGISAGVGQSVGGAQQNAGAYQAAGILGQSQALGNIIGGGTNAALQAYLLSQNQTPLFGGQQGFFNPNVVGGNNAGPLQN